ncbi:hypothetical protein GCM10010363_49110 [Streptomyces omiyaensis]|nr:hypothetical protein GCM10010363_49110 [Streptomyces omiyaensis]
MPVSYASALRLLRRVPLPVVRIPRVIGVDDFALRRRHSYATIIINAETGRRIEVLPGREAAALEAWLRERQGIEAVCRDGSATYAEAIRRALPDAIQISDRWHRLAGRVMRIVRCSGICGRVLQRVAAAFSEVVRRRWARVRMAGVVMRMMSRRAREARR